MAASTSGAWPSGEFIGTFTPAMKLVFPLGAFAPYVEAGARQLAQTAESAGFESLWTVEHVVVPSGYESAYPYDKSGKMAGGAEEFDLPDPLIWLTYVAAVTERIKLGTGILIVPQRNPLVTAKEVATLDVFSGGRVLLGVGVGWLKEEFDALGVPFADRGRRHDDYVEAMRALWAGGKASVHNTYANFDHCISRPVPVNGSVPIVVGGHTTRAAQRAARIGDGFFPGSGGLDELAAAFDAMRAECAVVGRDPAEIGLTDITVIPMSALAGDNVIARSENTSGRFDSSSPTTRSKSACGTSASATSAMSASEKVSEPWPSVFMAFSAMTTASAQTGVGTPSSAPRRATKPLRWSISLGLPRARSCAVEESCVGIAGASFSIACRHSSSASDWPSARATVTTSSTTSRITARTSASAVMRP